MGDQGLTDALNRFFDTSRFAQDAPKPGNALGIMTDVFLHEKDRIEQKIIQWKRDGCVDCVTALLGCIGSLGHEELECVEGNSHVACENFQELLIALRESGQFRTLDIDRPDD